MIGMTLTAVTHKPILKVLLAVIGACFVEVPIAVASGAAVLLGEMTAHPIFIAAISVSA